MKVCRFIFICLIVITILSVSAAAQSGYYRGDADSDGDVTILDATIIQRWLVGIPVSSFDEQAADVDSDGVSIIDVTKIQRYLAGIDNPNQIGEYVSYSSSGHDKYELPVV